MRTTKKKTPAPAPPVEQDPLPVFRPHGLTLTDWAKDTERQRALAAVLATPVFREALQTAVSAFLPRAPFLASVPGAEPQPQQSVEELQRSLALKYVYAAGFNAFFNALTSLAHPKPPQKDLPKPFGELMPEP